MATDCKRSKYIILPECTSSTKAKKRKKKIKKKQRHKKNSMPVAKFLDNADIRYTKP